MNTTQKATVRFVSSLALLPLICIVGITCSLTQDYPASAFPGEYGLSLPPVTDVRYPLSLVVYGDSREVSSPVKPLIIDKIIEAQPELVVHVGDMVHASGPNSWDVFDSNEGRIIDSGIPFYPVLGNHEYIREPEATKDPLLYFFDHFPFLEFNTWYTFRYGPVRFIILDSHADLGEGSPQYAWLLETLKLPSPGFTLIALHQPPYSKSLNARVPAQVEAIANLFENAEAYAITKPDIVFTGHYHNYERYFINGIQYVVTGGAGAPAYNVHRSKDDLYPESGPTYHYTELTFDSPDHLVFTMHKIDPDTHEWQVKDSFKLCSTVPSLASQPER